MKQGSCDDLINEALEPAIKKPNNKKMNKVKIFTFIGTIKELKERLAERVEEEIAQENIKKVREALGAQQKVETMEGLKDIVKPVEKFLEEYYKMFPYRRPKTDIKRRPFNEAMVDREYDGIQDQEQRWAEERDDDIERREEFETRL